MSEPPEPAQPRETGLLGSQLLEEAFLGEAAHLTREEVEATSVDFSAERIRGLWRALGFVDPAPDEQRFTAADVDALRLSQRLVGDNLIGSGITEPVVRAVGREHRQPLHRHRASGFGGVRPGACAAAGNGNWRSGEGDRIHRQPAARHAGTRLCPPGAVHHPSLGIRPELNL